MQKKRWVTAALAALTTALLLTGCGSKQNQQPTTTEQPTTQAATQESEQPGYRTKQLMKALSTESGYHVKTQVKQAEGADQDMTMDMYMKGSNIYIHYIRPNDELAVLKQGDTTYVLNIPQKLYAKTTEIDFSDMDMFYASAPFYQYASFTAGTETIDGVTYDYEETKEGGQSVRYYYLPGTDTWKYLKSAGTIQEILSYEAEVADSIFTIPSGFKEAA